MPTDRVDSEYRQRRFRRLLVALCAVALGSAGVLTLSMPAFALTLNQNDAGRITSVQSYNSSEFWLNVPTEYDVTSAAGPTSIPDQPVSTSVSISYPQPPPPPKSTSTGTDTGIEGILPTFNNCVLGSCVVQPAPYRPTPNSGLYYPPMANDSNNCTEISACNAQGGTWNFSNPVPTSNPSASSAVKAASPPQPIVTVTTVTDENIHLSSTLLYVQPVLYPIQPNGQPWGSRSIDASFCKQPSAPVISPSTMPGGSYYALHPWAYTQYWAQRGICSFNPSMSQNNTNQALFFEWLDNGWSARFDMGSQWSVTATYDQVTTVNGAVTASVPGSVTQKFYGPVYQGPVFPIKAITAEPCPVETSPNGKGVFVCADGQRVPVPTG